LCTFWRRPQPPHRRRLEPPRDAPAACAERTLAPPEPLAALPSPLPAFTYAARPAAHGGAAVASLARAVAFADAPGRCTVPLLTPQSHGVPFGLALQLARCESASAAAPSFDAPRRAHALHYLLRGSACVAAHGAADAAAGDAADAAACGMMHAGGLLLSPGDSALSAPGARVSLAPALCGLSAGWECASLLLVLPADADAADADAPLDAAAAAAAATRWRAGAPCPPLGAAAAADLLAGSNAWAREALPAGDASASASQAQQQQQQQRSSRAGGVAGVPPALTRRRMSDAEVYSLPGQSNRFALLYDPLAAAATSAAATFTFGLEVFESGHVTTRHSHAKGHELFVILSGTATAHCGAASWSVAPGDVVAFPPGSMHGLDVAVGAPRVYALELMTPNDEFAEYVRAGRAHAALEDADWRVLRSGGGGAGAR
jgi:quercetin dioxygenase-like cupin family protein